MTPLPRRFSPSAFRKPALEVARLLLGQKLVREEAGVRRAGLIVETEAYVGAHDLACHASKGNTPRTRVLFGPPGRSYVYLIYGMYHCFNVVTEPEGTAAAVLVRGLAPLEGIDASVRTDGPGRLCRALGITRADNELDLRGGRLYLERAAPVRDSDVLSGPRIGVDYAGEWAQKPYRLWIKDNPFVSRAGRAFPERPWSAQG